MNEKIAENVKQLRKHRSLTQEQLAEALGVTVGAVYKWENGKSIPEINMLMQLADLFEVSIDSLVGYTVQSSGIDTIEERLHTLQRAKKYSEALDESEKALRRYPNNFRIVYRAGQVYTVAGIELSNGKYLRRSVELLEHSLLLLQQNADPSISEVTINTEIAQCYIVLGKTKKGIDILKKYNVYGVHNALIAIALTGNEITYTNTPTLGLDDAVTYMEGAFGDIITNAFRTMMAYGNYFFKKSDYFSSREALLWLINLLESVKIDPRAVAYVDKVIAPCYSECAKLSFLLGEKDKVESYLRRAATVAQIYDASPTCGFENLKFCINNTNDVTMYDDLGETANAAVIKQLTQDNCDRSLYELWVKITNPPQ